MAPKGWRIAPLSSATDSITVGHVGNTSEYYCWQGILFLRTGNIHQGKIDLSDIKYIVPEFHARLTKSQIKPGDILVSRVGKTGDAALVPEDFPDANCANIIIIRCAKELFPAYLREYINGPVARRSNTGMTAGSVQAVLNIGAISTLPILIPPLPEQRKIAAILSAVDAVIERTQAVIDQLQQVKKALMQQLLTRGIPGRHTRFKQTEIGEVPEGWEISTVGQSCVLHNNLRKPIEASERERNPGSYPYYGPTKILSHINEFKFDGMYAIIGEDGDHFLKFDKWPMTQIAHGQFNVNNHAHVLSGTDKCTTQWFFQYFKHRDIVQHLTRQGAGRYKLRKATLVDLPIAIPSVDEQLYISSLIDTVESRIFSEEVTVQRLMTLKSALMSVLLSGEVRVKVDEEGAA